MRNPRGKRGSKWSNPVNLKRILVRIVRVWAHLSSFSSNSCSKAVQNDHIQRSIGTRRFRPRFQTQSNQWPQSSNEAAVFPKSWFFAVVSAGAGRLV